MAKQLLGLGQIPRDVGQYPQVEQVEPDLFAVADLLVKGQALLKRAAGRGRVTLRGGQERQAAAANRVSAAEGQVAVETGALLEPGLSLGQVAQVERQGGQFADDQGAAVPITDGAAQV